MAKQVCDLPTHLYVTNPDLFLEPCSNELTHLFLPPTHANYKETTALKRFLVNKEHLLVAETATNYNKCVLSYNDTSSVLGRSFVGTLVNYKEECALANCRNQCDW